MPYTEFSLDAVIDRFGLGARQERLFTGLAPHPGIPWLHETLALGERFARTSEKSRSEFIVAPILLTVGRLSGDRVTIFSGQRFDVEPAAGLIGECDFLLAATDLPVVRAPVVGVVEAKKEDLQAGLGQCAAQLVAADRFNRRRRSAGEAAPEAVYGCVTTGDDWRFLELASDTLTLDSDIYYLSEVGLILSAFLDILDRLLPPPPAANAATAGGG